MRLETGISSMIFSKIIRLLGLQDTQEKIKKLEKATEETYNIAMHNQCIILEITKIITDLAADQALLSEFIKNNSDIAKSTKSKSGFSIAIDDDDDFLN